MRAGEGSREHVIAAETHCKPVMSERLSKDGGMKRENSPFNNNRTPHLFLEWEERVHGDMRRFKICKIRSCADLINTRLQHH